MKKIDPTTTILCINFYIFNKKKTWYFFISFYCIGLYYINIDCTMYLHRRALTELIYFDDVLESIYCDVY